jgi:GAF domain-containing protein
MSTRQPADISDVGKAFTAIEMLARALHVKNAELQPTLDAIVTNAAATHPAARDAGLILFVSGQLISQAVTGHTPQALDVKQQETGDGPCIEAAREQVMIQVSDTTDDDRWPQFCADAQASGVRSMLCAPLWINEQRLGTLTLYAPQPAAFGKQDIQLIELFAALAALALADAQHNEQLRQAMTTRDIIGQAMGILMERYKVDSDAAFRALARASQARKMKVSAIARHLTETGELLGSKNHDHSGPG